MVGGVAGMIHRASMLLPHCLVLEDRGLRIRVLDLPALIAVKTEAGRPKDKVAIPLLIAAHGLVTAAGGDQADDERERARATTTRTYQPPRVRPGRPAPPCPTAVTVVYILCCFSDLRGMA